MSSIAVVTDSTADLPGGLEGCPIAVVPLVVSWGSESFRDKVDLTTAAFYERLRASKDLPKTGSPSPAAFEDVYRSLLATHDHVISIHLPGLLSSTVRAAEAVANAVAPDRIHVVDGGNVSLCLGWLVEAACRLGREGVPVEDVLAHLRGMVERLRVYAVLDTLEYVQKGGRIGRAQALAGTLLNVKPILSVVKGEVIPVERVRTQGAAVRRMMDIVSRLGPLERLAVVRGDDPTANDALAAELAPRFPSLTIERGEIGSVIGTYAGPGLIGVCLLLAA